MNEVNELIKRIKNHEYDEILKKLYVDDSLIELQRIRYLKAIDEFEKLFGIKDVEIYSAPGRTEIGGNHTDHQRGLVLAASVNLDAIAVASKNDDFKIHLKSEGYDFIEIDLNDLSFKEEEKETTISLIKGVSNIFKEKGYTIGGFDAYVTSDVLRGSGLSSSAAFEVLIGNILSGLYNDEKVSPVDIARFSQYAENVYFGKPSGLMDQMASSVGNLVNIDFKDKEHPDIKPVDIDFENFGYSLCVVDTLGNHADLTGDYAAVPAELKSISAFFDKDVLREVDEKEFYKHLKEIREKTNDRAVLRAIHIFDENKRVIEEVKALKENDFNKFRKMVIESGRSSYELLQNVFSPNDPLHQGLSLALIMTSRFLKDEGAYRVHGGGFAGTIQAFVKNESVAEYKKEIEEIFGEGTCHILKIRPAGGLKVM